MSRKTDVPTADATVRARVGGLAISCAVLLLFMAGCGSKPGPKPVNAPAAPSSEVGSPVAAVSERNSAVERVDARASSATSATAGEETASPGVEEKSSSENAQVGATYQIGPNDVLEIIYQVRTVGQSAAYRLAIQDQISIKFQFTPQYDRQIFVQSDGKVRLPLVGDVVVAGKTTEEIEDELKTKYSDYLKDPVIQVLLDKSNYAIEELKRAITTAPRGQSRLEPVRPDGYISLPLIGDVLVGGKTVPEASEAIVDKYRSVGVVDIDVTVVVLEVKSQQSYVLGEVGAPGSIALQPDQDVWRTIGQAGGFLEDADRSHVIVVKNTPKGETRRVLNFDAWQSGRDIKQTVAINRGDMVYVPKLSSRYVYILGEVEKPGQVALDPESQMTVSQAIALGGQIKAGANRTQVLVLRRTLDNQPVVLEVDLKALFNPTNYKDPDEPKPRDYALEPGDIVYVPAARIGNINRFAEAYFRDGIWTIIPFHVVWTLN